MSKAAEEDLKAWRIHMHPPRERYQPPNDDLSRASNRYLNFLTAGWCYPNSPWPLIHWSHP